MWYYVESSHAVLVLDGGEDKAPVGVAAETKEEPASKPPSTEKPQVITSGVPCPVLQTCPPRQFSYYVKSGNGLNDPPIICYNNELYVNFTTILSGLVGGTNISMPINTNLG